MTNVLMCSTLGRDLLGGDKIKEQYLNVADLFLRKTNIKLKTAASFLTAVLRVSFKNVKKKWGLFTILFECFWKEC